MFPDYQRSKKLFPVIVPCPVPSLPSESGTVLGGIVLFYEDFVLRPSFSLLHHNVTNAFTILT